MTPRQLKTAVAATIAMLAATADAQESSVNYIPEVHGILRTRWELATETGNSRFQVRDARVSVGGNMASFASYYVMADFCASGKFSVLDAYAALKPTKELTFRIGQFKIPFGTDNLRAMEDYYFSNRPFLAKQATGRRSVGIMASYAVPSTRLVLSGGIFNSTTISDHTNWNNKYAGAVRAVLGLGDFSIAANVKTVSPDSVRVNLAGGSVTWTAGRWTAEGEYVFKHYTGKAFKDAHGYDFFVNYDLPLQKCAFHTLSFQGRFDGLSDHSDGTRDSDGLLTLDEPGRKRLTLGSTLAWRRKKLSTQLRLNYEKYFYDNKSAKPANADLLTAEVIISF
jgi:hypothetical protein